MKLSTIRSTLDDLQKRPKQSLGQNFLHDQNIAAWIVDQLDLQPGEPWLELGPGLGALTEFAVRKSENGTVIEKDGKLIPVLRERFPQIEIIHGDATETDLRPFLARGPMKTFGNLPYYVSSQILFHYTEDPSPMSCFLLTLQKELALRLSAEPRTKDYGGLTLLIGRKWTVEYLRTLPPTVFTPRPKVESAVVMLRPRSENDLNQLCDGGAFRRLVKRGFAKRRKQLRKNLGDEIEDWSALCTALDVPETVRAEELSLEQWIALTRFVTGADQASPQDVHGEIFDVVNEADEVIGQASRHDVHRKGLRHRAVHVFVCNEQGELFLQRRSRWKDVHPLRWDSSAAGHVDAGQDYDPTAERELLEELGIAAAVAPIGRVAACHGTGWEFVRIYRAEHQGPFRLHPAEIDSGAWFTREQIDHWIAARPQDFATGFLECYRVVSQAGGCGPQTL